MGTVKRSLLWCVIGTGAIGGCVEAPPSTSTSYGPPTLGSGDKNTPYFNYYLDQLRSPSWWAPGTTGENSLSEESDLMFEPRDPTSPCVDLDHEPPVRVVGSYRQDDGTTIGSDALITVDDRERSMLVGERARTAAWLVNGAGRRDAVVLDLKRGNAIAMGETPWLTWPQFSFSVTSDATCETLAHAVVQFGPALRMPTYADRSPTITDGFGAYATLYREEHMSLMAKGALYGSIPVATADEPDQDLLTACGGQSVSSHETLINTMSALGNGAWGHLPSDPEAHAVEFFLTEEGFPVQLFAGATLEGGTELVELCWGAAFTIEHQGEPLPRLKLPGGEVTRLDAFHASGIVLAPSERAAGLPTNINRGLDLHRVEAFVASSSNPLAALVAEQVSDDVALAQVGEVQGPFESWSGAHAQLRGRVAQVTAASPIQSMFFPVMMPYAFAPELPDVAGDLICGKWESGCAPFEPYVPSDCPLTCADGASPIAIMDAMAL